MPPSTKFLRLTRFALAIEFVGVACCVRSIFIDPRSTKYVSPFLAAALISVVVTLLYTKRPSNSLALGNYLAIAAMVPGLAYGILLWPWIARGGAPLGQDSWAFCAFVSTLAALFIAWPSLFLAHYESRRVSESITSHTSA